MSNFKKTISEAMTDLFLSEIGTDGFIQTAHEEIIVRGHLRDYVDDADLGSADTGLSRLTFKTIYDELPEDFGQNSELTINGDQYVVTSNPQIGEGLNIATGVVLLDLRLEDAA